MYSSAPYGDGQESNQQCMFRDILLAADTFSHQSAISAPAAEAEIYTAYIIAISCPAFLLRGAAAWDKIQSFFDRARVCWPLLAYLALL